MIYLFIIHCSLWFIIEYSPQFFYTSHTGKGKLLINGEGEFTATCPISQWPCIFGLAKAGYQALIHFDKNDFAP